MSEFLGNTARGVGKAFQPRELSGTPKETRAGTQELANLFRSMFGGGPEGLVEGLAPFTRLGSQSFQSMYGVDPSMLGIGEIAQELLAHPEDLTAGLFRSMVPFEERETSRQVAGLREMYGTMGGRFSRNLMQGESELRGELGGQFARERQRALLEAGGQRAQTLLGLMNQMQASQAMGQQGLGMIMDFFRPGAPVYQEAMLPYLIAAAGRVAAAKMGG